MAIWGADVDQLRQLGNKLKAGAENIEQQRSQLKGALDGTDWKGPDADKFRGAWDSQHASNLAEALPTHFAKPADRAQKTARAAAAGFQLRQLGKPRTHLRPGLSLFKGA